MTMMSQDTMLWIVFIAVVLVALAADLVFFNRRAHDIKMREALMMSAFWIGLAIAFNVRYMTDVVRAIDAEAVEMSFTGSLSPCIISPFGDSDYVHLVLPVRTAY